LISHILQVPGNDQQRPLCCSYLPHEASACFSACLPK
jgi:hypothetical protein